MPSPSEAGPSKPSQALKAYNIRLNAQISSTRTHFQPDPEEFIPSNEWSAEDKAPFYPSLQRHSAHRIDLISKDTGKSEDHVRRYLNLLADGARSSGTKRSGRLGKDEWVKGVAPAAREVEEVDIQEEERLAGELLAGEELQPPQAKKRKIDETIWGESLDRPKLDALAALIHTSTPSDPLAGNKPAKILRDEQSLASLKAIPRDDQTASQQKEIRRLTEKKKMRNRYRMARLVEGGMTEQEVKEQGGPDAVYLARSGLSLPVTETAAPSPPPTPNADPLRGNKHAKIIRDEARLSILLSQKTRTAEETIEVRRLTNKKRARQRSRKQKLREEGMTDQELDNLDVDELFARRAGINWDVGSDQREKEVLAGMRDWVSVQGLDIWGFGGMGERINDLSISWDILLQMKVYLIAFLTPVILRAISIAEMELVDITSAHVAMVLSEKPPDQPDPFKEEELEWEIKTTTTDREEEHLDILLDDVDTAYDIVQEEESGDWTDPFGLEKRNQGGHDAVSLKKEYLKLLHKYTRRRARREARRAWTGTNGDKRGLDADEIPSEEDDSDEESSSASDIDLEEYDEDDAVGEESEAEFEDGVVDEDEHVDTEGEGFPGGERGDEEEDEDDMYDKHDKSDVSDEQSKEDEQENHNQGDNDKDAVETDEDEWP